MSRMEKLLVRGVRSFSPLNRGVIEFFSPLTIIVGHNGAGKTTIIECLKQACTGSMPPNIKSGQAFIHDPKLTGETETKAQIMLRFRDTVGNEIVVVRSFQLIQKASKMQFQKVDQSLQTVDAAGEKKVITYKCADIDATVPMLLGVSPAVLENVIFVHQEDSNWPLGESKTVKARFEAIFESATYVKAMETIRKLKNEKNAILKNLILERDHLHTKVKNVKELRAEMEKDNKEVQGAMETISGIEQNLDKIVEEVDALDAELDRARASLAELAALEAKLEVVGRRNLEMQQGLQEEYDESDDDLRALLSKVDARVPEVARDLKTHEGQLEHLQRRTKEMQQEHARDAQTFGQLSAEEKSCTAMETELRDLSEESVARHGLLEEGSAPASEPAQWVQQMQERVAKLDASWSEAMQERDVQEQKLSGAVDSASGEWTKNKQALSLTREKCDRLEQDLETAKAELRKLGEEERMVLEASEREHEAKAELESMQQAARGRPGDSSTSELQQKLNSLELEQGELRMERERLQSVAKEHIIHAEKQKDLTVKLEEISRLKGSRAEDLRWALGEKAQCEPRHVQGHLAAATEVWEKKISEQEKSEASASRSEAESLARLDFLQSQIDELNSERESCLENQNGAGGEGAVESSLREAEQAAQMARAAHGEILALEKLSSSYISHVKEHEACPVCEQSLEEGGPAAAAFMSKNRTLADDLPKKKALAVECLKNCEARLSSAKAAAPLVIRTAELESKINSLSDERDDLKKVVECHAETLQCTKEALRLTRSNIAKLEELQRLVGWPILRLSEECAKLDDAMPPSALPGESNATRTLTQVESALQETEKAVDSVRRELDTARSQAVSRQERLITAERMWREAREAGLRAREAGRARERASETLKSCEAEFEKASAAVLEMETKMPAFELAREEAIATRERTRNVMLANVDTAAKMKMDALKVYERMVTLHSSISKWKMSAGAAQLTEMRNRLAAFETAMSTIQAELEEVEAKAAKCRKTLSVQESAKRNLEDNIAYQKAKNEKENLELQTQSLRQKMGAAAGNTLQEERAKLVMKSNKLRQQQDLLRGASHAVQQRIDVSKKKLSSADLAGAIERFSEKDGQVSTHEGIVGDLEKYHKAMEKALVEYHESRMAAVNRIIRDLWRKAYKSGDIDYIFVRADAEGSSRGNYSYRLMMVAGGAELEMRGRCSAGQKVLACLIVRLALSEAFCVGCGIIALDEPTTNLDADNSSALARVLQDIIEARASHSNFQLLVITHDENFAQQLGRKQFCEHYWLVRKNENQCSEVLKQDVLE